MLESYFKIALRSLLRNRSYSLINIIGLAIGIACTGLIFLWVEDELTFNNYFTNKDNLFVVNNTESFEEKIYVFDATPGPLAQSLKEGMPGIKLASRCSWSDLILLSANEKNILSVGKYADPDFLKMTQLEFLKGNAEDAFRQLQSLVLTESTAIKLFGSSDVVGKTIRANKNTVFIVSGVVKDLPRNTSFQFEWLAPFKLYSDKNPELTEWPNNSLLTYVETEPNTDVTALNKKIKTYTQEKMKDTTVTLSLYPMSRWKLYNNFDENGKETDGAVKYVRLFSIIAWIILFIACINFMNLATASSEKRAREVGVRKSLGSAKKTLVTQFLIESLLMATLSGVLAVLIIYLALPSFNTLIEKQLSLHLLSPIHIGSLLIIVILCGLISGSYPAFYLSSFNPVMILKGMKPGSGRGGGTIRKVLVITQFSVSVILIICTLIVYKQIQHVKTRDIGYTKEGLLFIGLKGSMQEKFTAIKHDLLKISAVKNACLSNSDVLEMSSNSGGFTWAGKDPNKSVLIAIEGVSPEYMNTMGFQIVAGRDFYNNIEGDNSNILINESMATLIGKKKIIGKQVYREGETKKYTVAGVIKNFLYNSMYSDAQPLILFLNPKNTTFMTMRVNTKEHLNSTLAQIETVFKKYEPEYPFNYHFVEDRFDQLFQTEAMIGKLAGIFASLAIFISCLGLFGLASFIAERRAREISIRKVLGASVRGLTILLTKDFLALVIIACVIALPLAAWFMHNWLKEYEYRIELNVGIFILAAGIAVAIALFTVGFKAVRTALSNPVKSLRSE